MLRVVLATLWADHAAAFRNFAAANIGPELSNFAFKHLTCVNGRIRAAENTLKELRRLVQQEFRERSITMRIARPQ